MRKGGWWMIGWALALSGVCNAQGRLEPWPVPAMELGAGQYHSIEVPALPPAAQYIVYKVEWQGPISAYLEAALQDGRGAVIGTMAVRLLTGVPTQVIFPLDRLEGERFDVPRQPRMLRSVYYGRPARPEELRRIVLSSVSLQRGTLRLEGVSWAVGGLPPPLLRLATPFMDSLGYRQTLAGRPVSYQAGLDQMRRRLAQGALVKTGPIVSEKGRYGLVRDGERFWLRRPDGSRFISFGVNGVSVDLWSSATLGVEDLFAWLPATTDTAWAACCYDGGNNPHWSQARANAKAAFGPSYKESFNNIAEQTLEEGGYNTLGPWSAPGLAKAGGLPELIFGGLVFTRQNVFRDLPDVYSEEFAVNLKGAAGALARQAEGGQVLGYFIGNEPTWLAGDPNLALEMVRLGRECGTFSELRRWLSNRYARRPGRCRRRYGVAPEGLAGLTPAQIYQRVLAHKRAMADLAEFSDTLADAYVGKVVAACKAAAPGLLCFGLRYSSISSSRCLWLSRHFDVTSINVYDREPLALVDRMYKATGKPVLIGEFHFGSLAGKTGATGLVGVATEADRGRAYRRYLVSVASHPAVVGLHWFEYMDQPTTGRYDGENYSIGLVDQCQLPYTEFLTEIKRSHTDFVKARETGEAMDGGPLPGYLVPVVRK